MRKKTFFLLALLVVAVSLGSCSKIEKPHYIVKCNQSTKATSVENNIISQTHEACLYASDIEKSTYCEKQKVDFELSATSICRETAEIYHQKTMFFWRGTCRIEEFSINPIFTLVDVEPIRFEKTGVFFYHPDFPIEGGIKNKDFKISTPRLDEAYCEIVNNTFIISISVSGASGYVYLKVPINN